MELALAPAPATWGRQRLKDFYTSVASMPLDIVYIGETVCATRDPLSVDDLTEIAGLLRKAGERVLFSTLGLVTSPRDFDKVRELLPAGDGIEANSLGALNLLPLLSPAQELVAGAFLNVYNRDSAEVFLSMGASRVVLPAELPFSTVADIAAHTDGAAEVSVWGSLGCSISWRCYTARSLGRERADCGKGCMNYPEGMLLENADREKLFVIDGPQVKTARDYCLVGQLGELSAAGVGTARIHPSMEHTAEIAGIFREAADGRLPLREAASRLEAFSTCGMSNGWFHRRAGIELVSP